MSIWHVQCTLRQNLINSKRTVRYYPNTSIFDLNIKTTEQKATLIHISTVTFDEELRNLIPFSTH